MNVAVAQLKGREFARRVADAPPEKRVGFDVVGAVLVARWRQGPEVDPGPYLRNVAAQPVPRKAAA